MGAYMDHDFKKNIYHSALSQAFWTNIAQSIKGETICGTVVEAALRRIPSTIHMAVAKPERWHCYWDFMGCTCDIMLYSVVPNKLNTVDFGKKKLKFLIFNFLSLSEAHGSLVNRGCEKKSPQKKKKKKKKKKS